MKKKCWCRWRVARRATRTLAFLILAAAAFGKTSAAWAGAPGWLRDAARAPVPKYPDEVDAVVLFDEQITTVSDKGEIKTVVRRAYKILRPQGRGHGRVVVYFDEETRLTFLKAWAIPASGAEYEVKEKDAIETSPFSGQLYNDTRAKVLHIPAADPGNVIGYEYEQKRRPYVLQDVWLFQGEHPVRTARFTLRLPKNWEYKAIWLNHPARAARRSDDNEWAWELQDVPRIEEEPSMPHWRAVAGRMAVTYVPPGGQAEGKSHGSWRDVGLWYHQLASGRRQLTPEMEKKVGELVAAAADPVDKARALGTFVQRDIRYVAIEIGIGGYQPHAAQDVFANRYGDCKDKATLLATMLREVGFESYYVLVHADRGAVAADFPSMMNFNHVILAVRLPAGAATPNLYALYEHSRLGKLLLFDPTDTRTPFGYLPPSEQASQGLLVTEEGGELLNLPVHAPSLNRLLRSAKLSLTPAGTLAGEVMEVRWGSPASNLRESLLEASGTERMKVLESFLGQYLGGFRITRAQAENLEDYGENLILRYAFVAENYAQSAGDLLLVRPRVLGQKTSHILEKEKKARKYPVEFADASLQTDQFEITLPPGYAVDELPPPLQVVYGFGEYKSKVEVQGGTLKYSRTYQMSALRVPTEKLEELKKFYRQVAGDERASAVLKRAGP